MSSILGLTLETGITELIGVDEAVATDEYSGSVEVALGQTSGGFIDSILLVMRETGSGAIITETGVLYVFDSDPSISAGDAAMATAGADHKLAIARLDVAATDWEEDANGATVYKKDLKIPFHAISSLFFVYRQTGATEFNDAGADNEILEFNCWYRRVS